MAPGGNDIFVHIHVGPCALTGVTKHIYPPTSNVLWLRRSFEYLSSTDSETLSIWDTLVTSCACTMENFRAAVVRALVVGIGGVGVAVVGVVVGVVGVALGVVVVVVGVVLGVVVVVVGVVVFGVVVVVGVVVGVVVVGVVVVGVVVVGNVVVVLVGVDTKIKKDMSHNTGEGLHKVL